MIIVLNFMDFFRFCGHASVFIALLKPPCSSERLEFRSVISNHSNTQNCSSLLRHGDLSANNAFIRDTQIQPLRKLKFQLSLGVGALVSHVLVNIQSEAMEGRRSRGGHREISIFPVFPRMSLCLFCNNESNLLYPHVKIFASSKYIIGVCVVGAKDGLGCTTLSISVLEEKII